MGIYSWAVGLMCIGGLLLVGQSLQAGDVLFEVEVGIHDFVGPIKLKDGRFLCLTRGVKAMYSADGGRTWTDGGILLDTEGQKIGNSLRPWSLIRLKSGALAAGYWQRRRADAGGVAGTWGVQDYYLIKSVDEGKSWSNPVHVNWPRTPAWPQWLIQTKTGRLVLANEYWYDHLAADIGIGICTAYYSDDEGESWHESPDSLFVWEKDGAMVAGAEVPCAAETADGRILMFMRTKVGRIAQSYSKDDGEHWSKASLTDLVSSNAELYLTRIPTTGDLLCVWNQASTVEIRTGFRRARLTSAISKDSGKTWENFRTVAMSPGQRKIARVTNPKPPEYMKEPGAVPPKQYTAPEGFHMNTFPRVKFIDGMAYLVYNHRVYKYPEGATKWKREYSERRLRAFPISWFYDKKSPEQAPKVPFESK